MADDRKLTLVDDSNRGDHPKLKPEDECGFWREYTSGRDYRFGPGNDLISNLKKKPSRASLAELGHKNRVIGECAAFFTAALNPVWISKATLVPTPPSKAKDDPDYDDRMVRVCRGIKLSGLDVRELIFQTESLPAAHESSIRPTVDDLLKVWRIDEKLANPTPTEIGIFDDVLTAGVHFRAMDTILRGRFPGVRVFGLFIARRIFANPFEAGLEL